MPGTDKQGLSVPPKRLIHLSGTNTLMLLADKTQGPGCKPAVGKECMGTATSAPFKTKEMGNNRKAYSS
ncbi:MAG: hypothetical protein HUU08_02560 [Candidatus Brocadia sp.]|nr:hypothetical protein [Candidatus Brocadia sp.]